MIMRADNRAARPLQRLALGEGGPLWAYLVLITLAELLTSFVSPQVGQIAHVILLVSLILHGAIGTAGPARRMALALALAPLIRVLSLSLPLLRFPQLAWYPIVALPLLSATWVVLRQLRLTRAEVGLQPGNLPIQLLIAGLGFGLGVIEFAVLAPAPQLTNVSWETLGLASLNLLIFTGFSEELIFRGVLQSVALRALGRWALPYVALLFGVLHIGYLSALDVAFVSAVGLLFALIVRWGGSILGVTLAHGTTNVMLFLVLPYMQRHPETPAAPAMPWVFGGGTLLGVLAVGLIIWTHRFTQVRSPAPPPVGAQIRALRCAQGLTYVTLAQQADIAARALAEIEMGLQAAQPREILRIAAALGVAPEVLLHDPGRRDEDEELPESENFPEARSF